MPDDPPTSDAILEEAARGASARFGTMSEDFAKGDVVQLKPGNGPAMAIKSIKDEEVYCEWFLNGHVKGHKFDIAQLQKYVDPNQLHVDLSKLSEEHKRLLLAMFRSGAVQTAPLEPAPPPRRRRLSST